jgi:hypothetical protein
MGEKHDLTCAVCGETLGQRTVSEQDESGAGLIVPRR